MEGVGRARGGWGTPPPPAAPSGTPAATLRPWSGSAGGDAVPLPRPRPPSPTSVADRERAARPKRHQLPLLRRHRRHGRVLLALPCERHVHGTATQTVRPRTPLDAATRSRRVHRRHGCPWPPHPLPPSRGDWEEEVIVAPVANPLPAHAVALDGLGTGPKCLPTRPVSKKRREPVAFSLNIPFSTASFFFAIGAIGVDSNRERPQSRPRGQNLLIHGETWAVQVSRAVIYGAPLLLPRPALLVPHRSPPPPSCPSILILSRHFSRRRPLSPRRHRVARHGSPLRRLRASCCCVL